MTIAFDSTTESGFLKSDFDQIAAYMSNADDTTTLETRLDGIDTTASSNYTTLNDNINTGISSIIIHRKIFTSSSEINSTTSNYADTAKTFTLSAPVNSLVLGVTLQAEVKDLGVNYVKVDLKVTGTNLGTKYIINRHKNFGADHSDAFYLEPSLEDTEYDTASYFIQGYNTTYKIVKNTLTTPFKILDETTTFTIRYKTTGGTAYLKNAILTIWYVSNFTED